MTDSNAGRTMPGVTVVALLAAYNEEDIIGAVLQHLIDQGAQVYLLDHNSTDGTVGEAKRFLDRGLLRIEQFPQESGFPLESLSRFTWADILRRKEQLARELDADWFIHHDADEFRESPWPGLTVCEAIGLVDHLGFNAIDFEVLEFRPTNDDYRKGDDLLRAFRGYECPRDFDRLQVKAWKKADAVDLVSTGGHDVQRPDRRVFPVRFLMRHYPIRTQAQGERKVFAERLSRMVPEEALRGWHRQYFGVSPHASFLVDEASLKPYELEQARLRVWVEHREAQALAKVAEGPQRLIDEAQRQAQALAMELAWYHREWPQREAEIVELDGAVAQLQSRIAELHGSLSWRVTAPLRAVAKRFRRPRP